MKKIYVIIFLFCAALSFGQTRAVAKKVQDLNAKNQVFENFNLFSKVNDTQKASKYLTSATDVTILNMNSTELGRLVQEAPKYISLNVPYKNQMINVELYKQNIFTDSFIAKDEKGNVINYHAGQYYRGIVNGDYKSLVAISFFDNNVMGVISTYEKGNVILGKSVDKQDFITYSDKNILGQNPFVCGVEDIDYNNQVIPEISYDPAMAAKTTTEKCVKIYYEIAYKPYQLNGYDVDATIDWLTGIQNNISTLYDNDNINVALHSVKVWTVDDPYDGSYSENLNEFRQTVTDFEGDLAHLVNYPTTTSVAYVDSLCGNGYNYAYSGISMSYQQVPTYSWTVMAMTHEMGHSMGSPHTHHCAWNGNNTMIDGCGPTAGVPDEGTDCPTGPLPSDGGTIMSYCHLVPSVGINFLNGFGPQPGALIRTTVDSKDCLGSDCSCMFTVQDVNIQYAENGSVQAMISDNNSGEWKYRVYPFGEEPSGEWQTTTNTNISLNDLTNHVYYVLQVMNICDSGSEGGTWDSIILPGNYCGDELFTDTGGESGLYSNNEHWVKTFYPENNDKVQLSFERIGLQTDDIMYVHNGETLDAPLFDEGTIIGNNNPGPSFTSTDESGAITVEFVSNGYGAAYGWEATVDCSALGVEDMSDSYGITVYPNPTSDVLNIASQKGQIQNVKLTDAAGRTVITNQINNASGKINVSHLPKGMYILSINVDNKVVTKKIIKK